MNKRNNNIVLLLVALAIAIVVFNVIVFVFSKERSFVFWIGYGFSMVAFLLMPVASVYALSASSSENEVFLGLPAVRIGIFYIAIQLVVGIILMLFQGIGTKIAVVIEIMILAVYLIAVIATLLNRNRSVDIESKVSEKMSYLKSLSAEVQTLEAKTNDDKLRPALHALNESFRFSDPMSHGSLTALEDKIESKTQYLSELVGEKRSDEALSVIGEIEALLKERSIRAKALK